MEQAPFPPLYLIRFVEDNEREELLCRQVNAFFCLFERMSLEITPASMSIPPESPGVSTSSQRGPSFQELVELLDSVRDDQRRQAVAEMNRFSKDIKE